MAKKEIYSFNIEREVEVEETETKKKKNKDSGKMETIEVTKKGTLGISGNIEKHGVLAYIETDIHGPWHRSISSWYE